MNTPEDLDCKDFVELVTEYFEGTLAAAERIRLEAHLLECDGCEEYLAQMTTSRRLIAPTDTVTLGEQTRNALIAAYRAWKHGNSG